MLNNFKRWIQIAIFLNTNGGLRTAKVQTSLPSLSSALVIHLSEGIISRLATSHISGQGFLRCALIRPNAIGTLITGDVSQKMCD